MSTMSTTEVERDGKRYEVEFRNGLAVAVRLHSRSTLYDPHLRDVWRRGGKPASARTKSIIQAAVGVNVGVDRWSDHFYANY